MQVYHIRVVDWLSPDLVLREEARRIFELIESRQEELVVVDFTGVKSISRSFAHEYLVRRDISTKRIREENLPLNVSKMFEIARVVSSSKERWLPPPNEHNTIKLTREDVLAILKEPYKEQA